MASQVDKVQPDSASQRTEPKYPDAKARPSFVKTIPKASAGEAVTKNDEAEKEKAAVDRKIVELTGKLALYTGLLFLATVALAIGTFGLVIVGFRQVSDARESIAASVKAAEAAEKSAAMTEKALNNIEGPMIRPYGMTYSHVAAVGEITFCFRNFGRSAAIVRGISAIILVTDANNPSAIRLRKERPFMLEEMVSEKEISEVLFFRDDALLGYGEMIDTAEVDLHLMINFSWRGLLDQSVGGGERFIWSPKRQKFLPGVQLWDDPDRFPARKRA